MSKIFLKLVAACWLLPFWTGMVRAATELPGWVGRWHAAPLWQPAG